METCSHAIQWSPFSRGPTYCYACNPPKKKPRRIGLLVAPGKIMGWKDICDDIENTHQKVREHKAKTVLTLAGLDPDDFKVIRGLDISFPSLYHKSLLLCGISFGDRPPTQIYDQSTIADPNGKTWVSVGSEVAKQCKRAFEKKQHEEEQKRSAKPQKKRSTVRPRASRRI